MKMKHIKRLMLAAAILLPAVGYGQNIRHATNDELSHYILDSVKYVSKDFLPGVVTFVDGSSSRGALNIATINQKVLFVDTDGKIKELVNNDQVSRVTIGRRSFVRNRDFYVEIIELAGDVAIGMLHRVSIFETQKQGAYGKVSETTSIKTITCVQDAGMTYDFESTLTTPVLYRQVPYLYRNNQFLIPTKKAFIKCFPDSKAEIEEYVKANKVDFEKYNDVKALFDAVK